VLRRVLTRYFTSWWLPGAAYLPLLAVFALTAIVLQPSVALLEVSAWVLLGMAAALVGIAVAFLLSLARKNWPAAASNFGLLLVFSATTFAAFGLLGFEALMFPTEDHFADNLVIPADVSVSVPLKEVARQPGGQEDTYQTAILAALRGPGGSDPTVTADIHNLVSLQQTAPDVLKRYFATASSWRLFRERRGLFATRRMKVGSSWQYSLNGYYSNSDFEAPFQSTTAPFQCRLTVGLSGSTWAPTSRRSTMLDDGQTARLKLSEGNGMRESRCVVSAGNLRVVVFEQSTAEERVVTQIALDYVNKELEPLAASPDWDTIRQVVPMGAIRTGAPSFDLMDSTQPGIYDSMVWTNPGEPGMVYLKAYEVTQGTPLSVQSLRRSTNEWIGWSSDPQQQFYANANFSIYEGDWGKPYAARFEVWFVPDSGAPERKLVDRVFRIEGWER
jgi:hypothetical protein